MPSISMGNSNFSEEMSKQGTGGGRLHPEGEYNFRCVAIEFNQIKTVMKGHRENYLFFHWRSEHGVLYDYCTLSPKAAFQLANRIKALQAGASNPMVINYCGLIGRIAKITVEHENKQGDNGTYKVANPKYFNISEQKQQPIDISNPQFANLHYILQGYTIDIPEEAQGFAPDSSNIGYTPQMQQGYNHAQGQTSVYQQGQQSFQQPQTNMFQQQQQQDPYAQNFQGQNKEVDESDLPF